MRTKNDGGSAFPHNPIGTSLTDRQQGLQIAANSPCMQPSTGMSLRDYFAAKAMPVLATQFYSTGQVLADGTVGELVAKIAYKFADDMIAASKAKS